RRAAGAAEEAEAGIEEGGIDAVQVHVRNSSVGVEASLPALDVLHSAVVHRALPGSDPADETEALRAPQDLALDEQPFLAVGVDDHPRRAGAVCGIDVLVPDVDRLEDVSVGVDDVVGARHDQSPLPPEDYAPRSRSQGRRGRAGRSRQAMAAAVNGTTVKLP